MDTTRFVPEALATDVRPANDLIRAEQVRLLYANLPLSQSVALVNGVVLAALQATVIERRYVIAWLSLLVLVTLARVWTGMRFARMPVLDGDIGRWLAWFCAGAIAAGAVWGSAAWFLYPPDAVPYQVFLAFVLAGMVAGAVSLLTPVFPIYAAFALLALLPAVLRFLLEDDSIHYAMGGMGALFLAAMLVTGKRVHDTIVQSLVLRFDLLATQNTLRTSNEDLERRVAERTAALELADRRKDEFLAMLSHELRNPLAAISSSSYVLGRADARGEHAERARRVIERQARYLARLVDDLLDVTRIARGKINIRRERIDLADCVRRTAEDHGSLFEEHGVHLTLDLPAGTVWAAADPTRMAQLVGNLLQNAAKFTPGGGRVALSLRVSGEVAELRVADTGGGIDPAILPRLFEPFVQGDRMTARAPGGLGLGLALVKGIVDLHGGTMKVESDGSGAAFTVRIPLGVAELPGEQPAGDGSAPQPNRTVLVIDDNRDAADALALLVETLGHSTQVAYDGPTAIEMAHRERPDIVLCDLGLPGMTGYEVARRLRAERKDIKIIAVSGYTRPEDAAQATAAGFDGFVAKPPQPETILRWLS